MFQRNYFSSSIQLQHFFRNYMALVQLSNFTDFIFMKRSIKKQGTHSIRDRIQGHPTQLMRFQVETRAESCRKVGRVLFLQTVACNLKLNSKLCSNEQTQFKTQRF